MSQCGTISQSTSKWYQSLAELYHPCGTVSQSVSVNFISGKRRWGALAPSCTWTSVRSSPTGYVRICWHHNCKRIIMITKETTTGRRIGISKIACQLTKAVRHPPCSSIRVWQLDLKQFCVWTPPTTEILQCFISRWKKTIFWLKTLFYFCFCSVLFQFCDS